jgi:hypothetical protein
MTTIRRHVLQREYAGELLSKPLLEWLNRKRRKADRRRIERLLENLAAVRRFYGEGTLTAAGNDLTATHPAFVGASWPIRGLPADVVSPDFARGLREAREELSRHHMWPDLDYITGTAASSKGSKLNFRWNCGNKPASEAVLQIVLLGQEGLLWRVRQCSRCHRWFFARFKHQNFCRTTCQQEHYKHSPEWREGRRKYMQRYRRKNQ